MTESKKREILIKNIINKMNKLESVKRKKKSNPVLLSK